MAQLQSLAASLGLSGEAAAAQPAASSDAPQAQKPSAQEANASPEAAALRKLLPLLGQSMGREAQLFQAIQPFLSQKDQQRAERAMRAARLSRLAGSALRQLGDSTLSGLL